MQASAEDAPVIKLVYSVLAQAVGEGASDIHLEPEEGELRIRFRIDGVLKEAAHVPKRMIGAVISRLKIMSELDIAEKRSPRTAGSASRSRTAASTSASPPCRPSAARGRRSASSTRATPSARSTTSAWTAPPASRFEDAFRQAYGAVLVTGPTGSGKSTTLYAALEVLNEVEKNIITIEDPVEYRLTGINQIGVNRKAGLDFANGLRSILRADPDIIMVGEIRDAETARIAIEAALTGHMVLTTLHTNDAPGAITRLAKMGIESFLTASAVDCVVAQRLARKLCTNCKRRAIIQVGARRSRVQGPGADIEATTSRSAVAATRSHRLPRPRQRLLSDEPSRPQLKEMTVSHAPEPEIAAVAREEGMLTLREDGVVKVRAGMTSLEEVLRVTA